MPPPIDTNLPWATEYAKRKVERSIVLAQFALYQCRIASFSKHDVDAPIGPDGNCYCIVALASIGLEDEPFELRPGQIAYRLD
jgi:hypothetical protein